MTRLCVKIFDYNNNPCIVISNIAEDTHYLSKIYEFQGFTI